MFERAGKVLFVSCPVVIRSKKLDAFRHAGNKLLLAVFFSAFTSLIHARTVLTTAYVFVHPGMLSLQIEMIF